MPAEERVIAEMYPPALHLAARHGDHAAHLARRRFAGELLDNVIPAPVFVFRHSQIDTAQKRIRSPCGQFCDLTDWRVIEGCIRALNEMAIYVKGLVTVIQTYQTVRSQNTRDVFLRDWPTFCNGCRIVLIHARAPVIVLTVIMNCCQR